MTGSRFIVICKVEADQYWLAARNAFLTREAAEKFRAAISPSRDPLVVECPRGVDFREVER